MRQKSNLGLAPIVAVVLTLICAIVAAPIVAAAPIGRQGLVSSGDPWYVSETLSTSWSCHSLQEETDAAATNRTFGYYARSRTSTTGEDICLAVGATTSTTASLVCGAAGVPVIDPEAAIRGDAAITDFCWRSVGGTPLATFVAEW